MLIITATGFSRRNALRLGVSDCTIDEKRWTNEMLRVPVYSRGAQTEERQQRKSCAGRLR